MILLNPTSSNEAYVFSREQYALITITRGMFVILRAATKTNTMDVQMHQTPMLSTLSTGQRQSTLNGPHCGKLASGEGQDLTQRQERECRL